MEPATPGSDAFAALYRAHSQAIHYLALRYLGDPARAQDVTHDVFLKAWRHLGQFRHEAAWRTWLYRIAINHCRNLAASWAARNLVPSSDETLWNDAPDPGDSPLRILEVKELGERISRAMARLPEEYRLLLLLIADERLAYDQIAALTHQSTDAVRGKLHRARKAFAIAFAATA
ncbi:MAG: sigma-70 family RNA polymerase sigma factor [Verrucomicrobiae bacterium]|nr:sigma-70 family RNA polymerase sigma factor [Verrucomicrobiae bacterium]